jgi:hypothetical protein
MLSVWFSVVFCVMLSHVQWRNMMKRQINECQVS